MLSISVKTHYSGNKYAAPGDLGTKDPRLESTHESSCERAQTPEEATQAQVRLDGRIVGGLAHLAHLGVDEDLAVLVARDAHRAIDKGGTEARSRIRVVGQSRLERVAQLPRLEAEAAVEKLTQAGYVGPLDLHLVEVQLPPFRVDTLDTCARDNSTCVEEGAGRRVSLRVDVRERTTPARLG